MVIMVVTAIAGLLLAALLPLALIPAASAGCNCGAEERWDPGTFLDQAYGIQREAASQPAADRSADYPRGQILMSPSNLSAGAALIDASDPALPGEGGAISLPAGLFLQDNRTLRSTEEIGRILGEAGVSREDPAVVGGQILGQAAFLVWLLNYAGQSQVALLDSATSPGKGERPREPGAAYIPAPRTDLLASYDYVISGQAQLVDARGFQEYALQGIEGSINIRPEEVADGGRVKGGADLQSLFSRLNRNRPVVVYSDHYFRSTPVWYALQLMGYDARLYAWEDWQAHHMAAAGEQDGSGNASSSSRFTQISRSGRG
ncbi:MAG: hypothetical protein GKC10_04560 [Methanosarcinales archaeon]|nr:hypothetical protein [Methanosarcinales archaeon]